MIRILIPFALLGAFLAISIALEPAQPRGDIRISYTDITTLDPQMMNASVDIRVSYALYEGLMSFNPYTFKPIPGVAKDHPTISEDRLTYTYHLRKDAKWSDGSPVTAHDFKRAWRLGLLPDVAPKYIDFLYFLRGGKTYFKWAARSLSDITSLKNLEANARKRYEEANTLPPKKEDKKDTKDNKDAPPPPPEWLPDFVQNIRKNYPHTKNLDFTPPFGFLPGVSVKNEFLTDDTPQNQIARYEAANLREDMLTAARKILLNPLKTEDDKKQFLSDIESIPSQESMQPELLRLAKQRVQDLEPMFDELVGVKVPDDRTIVVELQELVPFFEEITATWVLCPLHGPTMEKFSRLDESNFNFLRDPLWTRPGNMVSNGPYVVTSWQFKRFIYLSRNPHYWNGKAVKNNSIKLVNYTSPQSMFHAFDTGEIDVSFDGSTIPFAAELAQAVRDRKRNDIHAIDGFGVYYYVFNTKVKLPSGRPNPFNDKRVRRAFNMVVNKQSIVDHVTRLGQKPTNAWVPPNVIDGYRSPKGIGYDPDQGRALLAEAGFPDGKGFPAIEILYNSGSGHGDVAQRLQKMWQDELKIKVDLKELEWKVFHPRRTKSDFEVARSGWFGDYNDPQTFLDLFKTGTGNNDSKFSNKEYDDLLNQAANEPDPEARFRLLEKAEALVTDDHLPVLPLYIYKQVFLYDPDKLKGVSHHPRNMQMFHLYEKIK